MKRYSLVDIAFLSLVAGRLTQEARANGGEHEVFRQFLQYWEDEVY